MKQTKRRRAALAALGAILFVSLLFMPRPRVQTGDTVRCSVRRLSSPSQLFRIGQASTTCSNGPGTAVEGAQETVYGPLIIRVFRTSNKHIKIVDGTPVLSR